MVIFICFIGLFLFYFSLKYLVIGLLQQLPSGYSIGLNMNKFLDICMLLNATLYFFVVKF